MFDVVRGRSSAPTRLRPALVVSLVAHMALLTGALLLSRPAQPPGDPPRVVWPGVKPGARTGSAGPAAAVPPKAARRAQRSRSTRIPLEVTRPVDLPPRTSSEEEQPGPGSAEGATTPGGPGGASGCATPRCGGDGPGVLSEDVVADMPVLLSGPEVTLSAEARRSGVEATLLVRCVITAGGTVEGCEVLRGFPLAEAAVLAALQARRYRPARIDGRPVAVRHLFTVHIQPAR